MPQNITGLAWNLSSSIYHSLLKDNLSSKFTGTPNEPVPMFVVPKFSIYLL